jgi:hypothetical protein
MARRWVKVRRELVDAGLLDEQRVAGVRKVLDRGYPCVPVR